MFMVGYLVSDFTLQNPEFEYTQVQMGKETRINLHMPEGARKAILFNSRSQDYPSLPPVHPCPDPAPSVRIIFPLGRKSCQLPEWRKMVPNSDGKYRQFTV